jgi:hypothetical protein
MGFFGKLWKGTKNIFSGIGNFVKSAFSGKNWWKTALVGATAYFGGAALGYWNPAGTGSIYGKFSGGDGQSGGGVGKWFGNIFGSEGSLGGVLGTRTPDIQQSAIDRARATIGDAKTFGLGEDEAPMAEEWLGGHGITAPSMSRGFPNTSFNPDSGGTSQANDGMLDGWTVTSPPPPPSITTGGGDIVKTGQGLLSGAANLGNKTQEYLLGPKGDSKNWGMAGNPWVQYGMLNAGASIFSDSAEEEAYGKAMGEGRALQNLNQPGNVSSGSKFTQPRQSASARQTQGTPKDEAIRMALATMTPEQQAAYIGKLYLEGAITKSEQTQFA